MKAELKVEIRRITQLKATSSNSKSFWNLVGGLLGKNRSSDNALEISGEIITDKLKTGITARDFFVNKVLSLAKLDTFPIDINKCKPIPPKQPLTFNKTDLERALKATKSKKCFGIDKLPLRVVKDFASIYIQDTLNLFNNIAAKGMPEDWRTARVLPLLKKGNRLDINNYRPISNLVSFGKLYEKLVLNKIEDETLDMEGQWQHGFRRNHSTLTACLQLQSYIAAGINARKIVAVYSIDLSAAFDLLRADILIEDLNKRKKLSEGLNFIILDFLWKRKSLVDVDGIRTTPD